MTVPALTHIFIDVDDTLYPSDAGIWPLITDRIHAIHERMGFDPQQIQACVTGFSPPTAQPYGLQLEFGADHLDYLQYVHNLDLSAQLIPDPELEQALSSLPQEKWVFTNASRAHAQRCMAHLGVSHCFTGIVAIEDTNPWCKPQIQAFERGLEMAGSPLPQNCAFVDDRADNLDTAAGLGMRVVLVSPQPLNGYTTIPKLAQLPWFFPSNLPPPANGKRLWYSWP